jgi:hypothetical protein
MYSFSSEMLLLGLEEVLGRYEKSSKREARGAQKKSRQGT